MCTHTPYPIQAALGIERGEATLPYHKSCLCSIDREYLAPGADVLFVRRTLLILDSHAVTVSSSLGYVLPTLILGSFCVEVFLVEVRH